MPCRVIANCASRPEWMTISQALYANAIARDYPEMAEQTEWDCRQLSRHHQTTPDPEVEHVAQASSPTGDTGHTMDPQSLRRIRALQRPKGLAVLASVLRKYPGQFPNSVDADRPPRYLRANDPVRTSSCRAPTQIKQRTAWSHCPRRPLQRTGVDGGSKISSMPIEFLAALLDEYANVCTVFRNEIAKEKQA